METFPDFVMWGAVEISYLYSFSSSAYFSLYSIRELLMMLL